MSVTCAKSKWTKHGYPLVSSLACLAVEEAQAGNVRPQVKPAPLRQRHVAFNASKRMPAVNTVLWFRKSLRLHDSPALHAALRDVDHLYPIFCLDPYFLKPER